MSSPLPTPKVSVIMAVRNTESYLPECLDSVRAQSYPHWELIAVNDHSTDGSETLLNRYASLDSRIRVFQSPGRRLNPALQEGYRRATGALVNRMDSDDRMPPQKLEILIRHWTQSGMGHCIAGGTEHFVDQGEVGDGFRRYERWLNQVAREGSYAENIYQECVIPSHCWMMHREDFDRVGAFDPDVYPEDYDLCFRLYRNRIRIVGIPDILHHWRDRADRISRTWEEYKDNRYFGLKLKYFFEIDHDPGRPLVLWGGGRNGKDLAKALLGLGAAFHWVCDNPRKTGALIYGLPLHSPSNIPLWPAPQIIVAVASPRGKEHIREQLKTWDKSPMKDYWFFL